MPYVTILINLMNGTIEITPDKQELRDFQADDFLTYQLPFRYDPEAEAPRFEKYLNEVLPDEESQRAMAEFMGYIFTRNLKQEKDWILYGSERNTKSVMFDIIRSMLCEKNNSIDGVRSIINE